MYDSRIGRFLSKDRSIGGAGSALDFNPYIYTNNNPISRIDPSGKSWWSVVAGAVVGAVSAVVAVLAGAAIGLAVAIAAVAGAIAGVGVGVYQYRKQNKGHTSLKGYTKAAGKGAIQGATGGAVGGAIAATATATAIAFVGTLSTYSPPPPVATSNIIQNSTKNNTPQEAVEVMKKVIQNNGKLEGFVSKPYKNISSPMLPTDTSYFEHDIYPIVKGVSRGAERLVFGKNGSVYFTPDHYTEIWIKLK